MEMDHWRHTRYVLRCQPAATYSCSPLVKVESNWLVRMRCEHQLGLERFLCENGADWYTALVAAARAASGDTENIQSALKPGMDVDQVFRLAAQNGHFEAVRFLVDHGADVTSKGMHCIQIIMPIF